MPPPKYAPVKKRRSRRAQDFMSLKSSHYTSLARSKTVDHRSPGSKRSVSSLVPKRGNQQNQNDSDSDTACGFDSSWRGSSQL